MSNTTRKSERSIDIERALSDPRIVHGAMREASQQAIRAHQLAGQPLVVWRDGRTVWLDPYTLEPTSGPPQAAAKP